MCDENRIIELEEENRRLREAIEWVLECNGVRIRCIDELKRRLEGND
jgi:hypothetical protein